ncbi:MAG TPA: hypothetical protein VJU86_06305 [Pyrinomonadaceae bacterium]|nr:hypothetical protein [Pyrinomonadaceae bacterium]
MPAFQIAVPIRLGIGHAKSWMLAGDQTIAISTALENRIVTIEVIATSVRMVDIDEEFLTLVPVQIVQFKFNITPVVSTLFFRTTERARILHHPINKLARQPKRVRYGC